MALILTKSSAYGVTGALKAEGHAPGVTAGGLGVAHEGICWKEKYTVREMRSYKVYNGQRQHEIWVTVVCMNLTKNSTDCYANQNPLSLSKVLGDRHLPYNHTLLPHCDTRCIQYTGAN